MILNIDAKFEEKLASVFKNDMKNLVYLNVYSNCCILKTGVDEQWNLVVHHIKQKQDLIHGH